jgi:3'-phosphoadenosine 5'-phosphosulfate sulfotransferase (PAPS reductase)/FAD synthetase
MSDPLVVSYGGGVDSLAMCIGMKIHGYRPDAIVFADTRGEKPETYFYLRQILPVWLAANDFPPLTTVCRADFGRTKTGDRSLEEECLRLGYMPSRAYGYSTCADKWKIDPFKWWAAQWAPAQLAWAAGTLVQRAIGFEFGEEERMTEAGDKGFTKVYPLIDWKWDRDECVRRIHAESLPIPPKSACFYCPSSTKPEILELHLRHPELSARATIMEAQALANGKSRILGLGRRFAWGTLIASVHPEDFPEAVVEDCTVCKHGS